MCFWKCLLNALIFYESQLIKILMFTLRGFDLGIPPSSNLIIIALSSRFLLLLQDRPSSSLLGSLEWGGGVK